MEKTEKEKVPTKRELTLNRMKARYPEENFDDDEALFGRINGDYDDYDRQIADRDAQIENYKKNEKAFGDMFSSDPRSARWLTSWKRGEDPAIALIRELGSDIKEIIDDPERQEEVAKANKDFAERVAKEKEYEELYKKNLDESLSYIDKLKSEGMSDDEIDRIMEFVITIVRDGLMGKFTPETIEMARKALNHDSDVAAAEEEGVVRGKNTRIDEKLRKGKKGDGTAALGGNNGGGDHRPMPNLGALEHFGDNNQTIWERGNEKRTPAR